MKTKNLPAILAALFIGTTHWKTASAQTWIQTSAPSNNWASIAVSAGGTRIVAVAGGSHAGPIYTSTDYGVTWVSNSVTPAIWADVASSADGTKLVAVAGGVYTNSGTTWALAFSPGSPGNQQFADAVASSADGSKLVIADSLLFSAGKRDLVEKACRTSSVGKLTPTSLYIHTNALETLDPLLRVYEGCARALVGTVDQANIVKLRFVEPIVSYLSYPNFETDPHPALASSLLVHLQTFRVQVRQYTASENPPILHRKEVFVRPDDPLRPKYERLTRQEEAKGLYETPSEIGNLLGWQKVLALRGVRLSGHRLLRAS